VVILFFFLVEDFRVCQEENPIRSCEWPEYMERLAVLLSPPHHAEGR
jgi:hypothetical protein